VPSRQEEGIEIRHHRGSQKERPRWSALPVEQGVNGPIRSETDNPACQPKQSQDSKEGDCWHENPSNPQIGLS
jgi:hypothetical protein